MKIIKSRISSKCTDGAIVNECTLDTPMNDDAIGSLQEKGVVTVKRIGKNGLFTFTCDLLSIKGMVGDTILYVSHKKVDTESAKSFMNSFFESISDSDI